MRLHAVFVIVAALCSLLPLAAPADADTQARFLAGLPVRGSSLEARSLTGNWAEHATALDQAWAKLTQKQLDPIRAWAGEFLDCPPGYPLFYMFSGPDWLYAHAFFPKAGTYVLCGIEPVGPLPEVESIPNTELEHALRTLRQSLDSVLNFSFFITKQMRVDFEQTRLQGTLPVLYVFLARSGCHINDVSLVNIDSSGKLTDAKTSTRGVKIRFNAPGAEPQTLYYFAANLADDVVNRSGFLKWCDQFGKAQSFLKASSYLMHEGGFDSVRQFLLSHSALIVQDDAGIPVKFFDPAQWTLRLFGAYPGPIEIFKQHFQPQLSDYYQHSHPPRLPFGFGYRWRPAESSLIIATPKSPLPN